MAVTTTPHTGPGAGKPAGTEPRRIGSGLLDPKILWNSLPAAFKKLDPRVQLRNPVMFVVEVGAAITTYTAIFDDKQPAFNWTIVVFLWLTVVFANLAEAVAEGRGKAQAETLRRTKRETVARRLIDWHPGQDGTREEEVPGTQLTLGDHVVVEAAGDVNTLLLDKTGTITIGNREATEFLPVSGVSAEELASAAQLSSMADYTPEGRSITVLAKTKYGLRERPEGELKGAEFVEFTAQTRMSGIDLADGRQVRKGAASSVAQWVRDNGGTPPDELGGMVDGISAVGGTPLVVAERSDGSARALGVIYLKDIVKEGMAERFDEMRRMGIRTVMITGDNPLTAKAIADESGVDDFLAEATPEDKLALIRKEQEGGKLVAMTGDGTNDAPALAQADVGVAMNTGTSAAKEAGNMVDLDSNPTKLIEIVEIGKQLLITRGALTTFSITNDVAKYFAIIPAMFSAVIPGLAKLNILHLYSPKSAITSAIIFNALIIVALIPLALRGVRYRPASASSLLRRNLLIYGVGGVIAPFPGIWLIDRLLGLLRLA